MSWVRAIVYVNFTEGHQEREESLYVGLQKRILAEEAQEACAHWTERQRSLHRRNVSNGRVKRVVFEGPHGWETLKTAPSSP